MVQSIKNIRTNINWSLYIALIFTGLLPTIYTTFRIYLLNDMPSEWGVNIASQIQWLALIYEVFQEGMILPLFYLFGQKISNHTLEDFSGRIKSGMCVTFVVYLLFAIVVYFNIHGLVIFMGNKNNIAETVAYIKLETVAFIFLTLNQIVTVVLTLLSKEKYIYSLLALQMVLTILFDLYFLSQFSFSLKLGVQGIAYSNIISYGIIFFIGFILINHSIPLLSSPIKLDWLKDWIKIGVWSGLESLVRNLAYILMIIQIMNSLSKQGTYWQVTSFIWGWLLIPILKLGEIIKRDVAESYDIFNTRYSSYITITTIISILWVVLIPFYNTFFIHVMNIKDTTDSINLLFTLIPFYIAFSYGQIWTSFFYGIGKTDYLFKVTICMNILYYGAFFFMYKNGIFVPTLLSVAIMFGTGMTLGSIMIYILFKQYIKNKQ